MKKCPFCKADIQENASFCLYCMNSLEKKEDVTPKEKKKKRGILALICVILSALLLSSSLWVAIPLFLYFFSDKDEALNGDTDKRQELQADTNDENKKDPARDTDDAKSESTGKEKDTQKETQAQKEEGERAQSPCALGHDWEPVTDTVHHEEQGHYENVITGYNTKKTYKCALCYKDPFESLELYYQHFDSHIQYDGDPAGMLRERYEVLEEKIPIYVEKWVVDTPAFDEEIVVGYVCTVCGEEKEIN